MRAECGRIQRKADRPFSAHTAPPEAIHTDWDVLKLGPVSNKMCLSAHPAAPSPPRFPFNYRSGAREKPSGTCCFAAIFADPDTTAVAWGGGIAGSAEMMITVPAGKAVRPCQISSCLSSLLCAPYVF